jgi:cytochrome P450
LSSLLHGRDPLTRQEAISVARLLLVAGTETTTHLIATATLASLAASSPDRKGRTSADFIRAALRQHPPVRLVHRVVTTASVVDDHRLEAGDVVEVNLEAAIRARGHGEHAERLTTELAFGAGPHRCPGAHLAVLEATIALDAVRARLPSLRLAEDVERIPWIASDRLSAPARLLVTVS